MTRLAHAACLAVMVASLPSAGCTTSRQAIGGQCELSSECQDPLVCRLDRCRLECASTRDCPVGALCAKDENGIGACLLPDEEVCAVDSDCAGVLRCLGGTCSEECRQNRDCAPGALCVCVPGMDCEGDMGQHLCVNPSGQACASTRECPDNLRCGRDGRCRPQCQANRDCVYGDVCQNGLCGPAGSDGGVDASADADAGTTCMDDSECMGANVESAMCVMGRCEVVCVSGFASCDGTVSTGCEADLQADAENCGLCAGSCGLGGTCTTGGCDGLAHVEVDERNFCVTRGNGVTYCTGHNAEGQLGRGTTADRELDLAPVLEGAGMPVRLTSIAVAPGISCGIEVGGATVVCMGNNFDGAVGVGDTTMTSHPLAQRLTFTPTPMPGITQITAAGIFTGGIASEAFVCARDDVEVWCWGHEKGHGLGVGITALAPMPIFRNALDVAAGNEHACVVLDGSGNQVQCWGIAGNRLGPAGVSMDLVTPTPVSGVAATRLDASNTYTCAVTTTNGVMCWGDGISGQLGTGAAGTTSSATPVSVAGLDDAALVDVGNNHACALRTGGGVRCWGSNFGGLLGDGSMVTESHTPVDVPGLTATAISAGGLGTCAIRDDGALVCWGGTTEDYGVAGARTPWPMPTVHPDFPPTPVVP